MIKKPQCTCVRGDFGQIYSNFFCPFHYVKSRKSKNMQCPIDPTCEIEVRNGKKRHMKAHERKPKKQRIPKCTMSVSGFHCWYSILLRNGYYQKPTCAYCHMVDDTEKGER